MKKTKTLLTLQTVLCVASAICLIVADLMIYFHGVAAQKEDPMAQIYSVDAISGMAVVTIPVILAAVIVTIVCAVLKVKDENADKPVNISGIRKNTESDAPVGYEVGEKLKSFDVTCLDGSTFQTIRGSFTE